MPFAQNAFVASMVASGLVSSNDEFFSAIAVRVVPGQITTPWIKD